MELLHEIEEYWTSRAEGYSQVNQEELAGENKGNWKKELKRHLPAEHKDALSVLDIGTGPGFFSIILTEEGYHMTAVDYTEAMLEEAKKNAGELAEKINFMQMDAQKLKFSDESFDVIVTRNLTWNLENPEQAYSEWHRVLKKGGILLNYDANWYHHLYDEEKRREYEADRRKVMETGLEDHYTCTDIDTMEEIAKQVPLSSTMRPGWDQKVAENLGFREISIDTNVWENVWSPIEKVNYASTPMFLVKCVK